MNRTQRARRQQLAMNDLLTGEFAFLGLISTRRKLLVPIRDWTYQRSQGASVRTVRCFSAIDVPHGNDAAVFRTLVHLYTEDDSAPPPWLFTVTSLRLHAMLSLLFPHVILSDQELIESFGRLLEAEFTVRLSGRRATDELMEYHFALLTSLEVTTQPQAGATRLDTVTFSVAGELVHLHRTGSFSLPPGS